MHATQYRGGKGQNQSHLKANIEPNILTQTSRKNWLCKNDNNLTAHAPTQPPFVCDACGFVTTHYFSFSSVGRRLGIDTICPAMSFRSARLSSRSCATQATHSGACLHPLWTASIAFPPHDALLTCLGADSPPDHSPPCRAVILVPGLF